MIEAAVGSGVERWTDRAEWDRFVAASPQGSVFARSAFLDALDRPWEAWRLRDGAATLAAALVFREPNGEPARAPLPFTLYQGLFFPGTTAPAAAHRRVREELEATERLLAGMAGEPRLSWCLHPAQTDVRAFSWFHYHAPEAGRFAVDVRYTGAIELAPAGMEPVLGGCRSVRRQEYRKAAARFRVERSTDLGLLDRLHAQTFTRQGIDRPPREPALLESISAAALRDGFGEMLVARTPDGAPAGAALFLFDATTTYYFVAANDPAYRSAGVSTLLFLEGVAAAIERGSRRFDVVGMNSPTRGDFKTSFGALPVPYYVVQWDRP